MLDDIRFTKTYATLPLIFTVNDSTIEKAAYILVIITSLTFHIL